MCAPQQGLSHTDLEAHNTLSQTLKFFVKNITLGAPELFLTSERCSFHFPSTKLLLLGNFVQIPAYWIELWAICCLATLANWTFCDRSFGALAFNSVTVSRRQSGGKRPEEADFQPPYGASRPAGRASPQQPAQVRHSR